LVWEDWRVFPISLFSRCILHLQPNLPEKSWGKTRA
jgi:hypothetical protein